MTTKVNNTVSHKTSQRYLIVTEGKLVLITTSMIDAVIQIPNNFDGFDYYKPIIVSETERPSYGKGITLDCKVYDSHYKIIRDEECGLSGYKILVLPENFSPKQKQAIVNGKLKDGDKVLVECEIEDKDDLKFEDLDNAYIVKLNKQSHATIHKFQESWEMIYDNFKRNHDYVPSSDLHSDFLLQFLINNYNTPVLKEK